VTPTTNTNMIVTNALVATNNATLAMGDMAQKSCDTSSNLSSTPTPWRTIEMRTNAMMHHSNLQNNPSSNDNAPIWANYCAHLA